MKRVAAITAVLAILVLGVLVGVLGTHLYYAQKLRRPGSFSMMAEQFFAQRLDHELSLSAEQRQAIAEILAETRRDAGALRERMRPRVGRLMERASERISEVLTPEQRERFAELRARHRGRAEHFFLGPPGPPGPPGHPPGRWHRQWHGPSEDESTQRPSPEQTPTKSPPPQGDS